MKVELIRVIEFFNDKNPSHPRDVIPSFELLNIASFLDKKLIKYDHFDNETMCFSESSFLSFFERKIKKIDLFFIHFQPLVNQEIINFIKSIKKANKKSIVIVFSPIVNQQTELFLQKSGADVAIVGEIENTAFELFNLFKKYKTNFLQYLYKTPISGAAYLKSGTLFRNPPRKPIVLDELPFMAHHLLYNDNKKQKTYYHVTSKSIFVKDKIKWGFLLSSRGCPYGCTFCSPSIRNSTGRQYRVQSPKRTVDEIEYLVKTFQVNAISFEDDLFTINRSRVIGVCKEILDRKIKISWTVATRLDCLDLELVQWMKKAGCFGMSAGVESGSDRILKLINKGEKIADLKRGMSLLHKVGIAVTTNLIIGHPTETIEDVKKTMRLAKELNPVFIHLHYLTPYPGTQIFAKYKSKLTNFKDFSHWKAHDFNVSEIETKVLKKLMKKIYIGYYFRLSYVGNYFKHRYQYYLYNPIFEFNFLFSIVKYLFFRA